MTPSDAARLLTLAAAFDQRTIGEADALAWAEALGDIDQADARTAVTEHYRNESRRLMPVDVLTGVRRIRSNRLADVAEQVPDADPNDVAAYLAALREQRYRVANGEPARPVAALVASVAERKSVSRVEASQGEPNA